MNLDQAASSGTNDVHIDLCITVFGIVEVEQALALHDANRNGCDLSNDRLGFDMALFDQPLTGEVEGNPRARDRSRPRPTIGVDDVAVDRNGHLWQALEVDHRAKRAAD